MRSNTMHILTSIYTLSILLMGNPAGAQWTAGGTVVVSESESQFNHQCIGDGAGGVIVTWRDSRCEALGDIYAQRLNALGFPCWQSDGVPVCTLSTNHYRPQLVSDAIGGAIIVW